MAMHYGERKKIILEPFCPLNVLYYLKTTMLHIICYASLFVLMPILFMSTYLLTYLKVSILYVWANKLDFDTIPLFSCYLILTIVQSKLESKSQTIIFGCSGVHKLLMQSMVCYTNMFVVEYWATIQNTKQQQQQQLIVAKAPIHKSIWGSVYFV